MPIPSIQCRLGTTLLAQQKQKGNGPACPILVVGLPSRTEPQDWSSVFAHRKILHVWQMLSWGRSQMERELFHMPPGSRGGRERKKKQEARPVDGAMHKVFRVVSLLCFPLWLPTASNRRTATYPLVAHRKYQANTAVLRAVCGTYCNVLVQVSPVRFHRARGEPGGVRTTAA